MEVFYDGACPLCIREINMIRRKDTSGSMRFIDISDLSFVPDDYGKTLSWFESSMRTRVDGEWVSGVESFRQMYTRIGFKKSVAFSRWPVISQSLDVGYWMFARVRPLLPGRKDCTQCQITIQEEDAKDPKDPQDPNCPKPSLNFFERYS